MPIHDWTRVPAGIYHHFHGMWIAELCKFLKRRPLPVGYYALIDQSTRTMGPDVLTLQRPVDPSPGGVSPPGPVSLVAAPPRVSYTAAGRAKSVTRPRKRVAVRHVSDHRIVAIIELVSPANKSSRAAFRDFLGKVTAAVREGVHVMVIDPFPPTRRDPRGLHAAVWDDLVGEDFVAPAGKPLTLASYAAGDVVRSFVEPIAVGDVLPDMPLFLESDTYVPVGLEATYQEAWQIVPDEWAHVLASS